MSLRRPPTSCRLCTLLASMQPIVMSLRGRWQRLQGLVWLGNLLLLGPKSAIARPIDSFCHVVTATDILGLNFKGKSGGQMFW